MKLLGIEVSEQEADYLFCEQSKGKELKVADGKVVAIKHESTQAELLQQELNNLLSWFAWYDNQISQYNRCIRLGMEFDKDVVALDNQAKINQERIAQIRAEINGDNP